MKRPGVRRHGRKGSSAIHPEGPPPDGAVELRGLLGRARIETGDRDGAPPAPESGPHSPAGRSPDALAGVEFEGVGK